MKNLKQHLQEIKTVAILGHINPDGDCVGSCLASYNYIHTYFPHVSVDVYLEPIPTIFEFLMNAEKIHHTFESEQTYDLCIVQDCGDLGRLGKAVKFFHSAKKTICIDHHISNSGFADENYIFPDISSTSQVVFELLEEDRITKEIAECIYLGMIHDTGVFQYPSTTHRTMEIAGKLMNKGIDFTKIIDDTFYTKTYNQNRILGRVLLDSTLYLEGKCIFSSVNMELMKEFDVLPKHLDGIVNQLRVTKGTEVAVFIYELPEGGYKVSMRSNGKVDVSKIALKFQGGGHVLAAGASMKGTVEEIISKICCEVEMQLDEME